MVRIASREHNILSAVTHLIYDMAELLISEAKRCACDRICAFLNHPSVKSGFVSGQTFNDLIEVQRVI